MRAASSSRSACLRLDRVTWAPCSAGASAMALPLPRRAPGPRAPRPPRLNGGVWVVGQVAVGVKVQVGIAKRMNKPVRYFDISDLPVAVMPISEETAQEELRD